MKKVLSVLLVLCTMVTFAACTKTPATLDLDAVRQAVDKLELLGMTIEPNAEELDAYYGINADLVEKGIINLPATIINSSMYIVVLPKDGKDDTLKSQLDAYIDMLSKSFEGYLLDQYQLVEDRLETTITTKEGTYLVYIVSTDNEAILNAIKSGLID